MAEYQIAIIHALFASVEDLRAIKDYFEKGFSTEFVKKLPYRDVKVVRNLGKEARKLFKKLKAIGKKVFMQLAMNPDTGA